MIKINPVKNLITSLSNKLKQKTWYGMFNTSEFSYTDYEKKDGFSLYKISLYLNKAISKRAEKVGETKFLVKDLKGAIVNDTGEAKWIYDLFNRPNKLMSGKQFFSTLEKQKDLIGKAYVLCVYEKEAPELFDTGSKASNKIKEMHLLEPTAVKEVFDEEKNEITSYNYRTRKGGDITYKATQIVRIVRVDPQSPLQAESLIVSGLKNISTGIQLDDYQSNVLKNGGSVKGILKFKDQTLTREEVETQKDRYKEQYAGAKKSGIPMFLGGNVDYQQTGLSPDEIGYLESKNCNLNDICILTGVPKSILGNFDEIKYDNAEASYRIFLKETITPEVREIVEAFNWTIIPDKWNLTYEDIVKEDKEEIKLKVETGNSTYSMTTNEKRRLQGLDDIKGGDTILIPINLVPMSVSNGSKAFKSKSFSPIIKEEARVNYAEAQLKYIDQRSKQLQEGVVQFANEQEKRVFKALTFGKSIKKGFKLELDGIKDQELSIAVNFIMPYLEELVSDSGNGALDLLGISKPLSVTERMQKIMDKRAKFYAQTTTDTTFTKLEVALTEGFGANETIVELTDRVKGVFTELKTSRAELIARTESTVSNNEGLIEGYRQSEVVTGKEWVAVMDNRTREEHAMLDGEIVDLNGVFSNGLSYPSEPNCRCLIGPAMEDDE
jgi:HK97 family phage portal protein